MAHLAGIALFPVKSMSAVPVPAARVLRSGALDGDRSIGLFDSAGKFVNGKRTAAVHTLRMSFDAPLRNVQLGRANDEHTRTLHLDHDREAIHAWLTEYFGFPVVVQEDTAAGWPDDTDSPGPTLISTATLREVARWFPELALDEVRARFRTNLEIDGVEPFWEDRLYGPAGTCVKFRIGDVEFHGINPCQRCAVPPRDTSTGELYPRFSQTFRDMREKMLPPWADRSRFNHFYRLAINTVVPATEAGKTIRCGDRIELVA